MNPTIDIHDRLAAEMANPHAPEGVSVSAANTMTAAEVVAKAQASYPHREFTGVVLAFLPDEIDEGVDEWVFEVRA